MRFNCTPPTLYQHADALYGADDVCDWVALSNTGIRPVPALAPTDIQKPVDFAQYRRARNVSRSDARKTRRDNLRDSMLRCLRQRGPTEAWEIAEACGVGLKDKTFHQVLAGLRETQQVMVLARSSDASLSVYAATLEGVVASAPRHNATQCALPGVLVGGA